MQARIYNSLERIAVLSHEISTIIKSYEFPDHRRQHFMMIDTFRKELVRRHGLISDTVITLTNGSDAEIADTENKLRKQAQSFKDFITDEIKILKWATSNQEDVMTYHEYTTHTGYRGHTYKTYDKVTFVYTTASGEEVRYNLHGMRSYWGRSSLADEITKKILDNPELKLSKISKSLINNIDKLIESERIMRTKRQLEINERAENDRTRRRKLKTELMLKNAETENLRKLSIFKDTELQQVQKKLATVDIELQKSVSNNAHLKVENHELKVQVTRTNRLRGK